MKRTILSVLLSGLLLILAVGAAPAVQAQTPEPDFIPGPELILYADSEPSTLRIPAPDFGPQRAAANIQVTFLTSSSGCESFPPAAQTTYLYAANIWAGLLNSNVPIQISACWRNLGDPNILGSAGSTYIYKNFPNAPVIDTYYPLALANSLAGNDLIAGGYEITSSFNSTFTGWYFGTGGAPSYSQWDFASVVLHEIGHGLGFSGSMSSSSGSLTYRIPPNIYDRFTENAAGVPLLSLGSPSSALTTALTGGEYSGGAYFDGPNATAANGGSPVPLYSPGTWRQGSSYSHVSQSFDGGPNTLMTFSVPPGEMTHNPGPVALGILRDIGWSVTAPVPAAPSALNATTASASQINLTWSDNSSNETNFELYRSTDSSSWAFIAAPGQNATAYSNTGLTSGTRYYYRVRAVNASGASAYSNSDDAITSGPPPAPSNLNAQAFGETLIVLTWSDNSNIESGYAVERKNGANWDLIATTAANAATFTNTGLTKTTPYTYRVRTNSSQGQSADYSNEASATTWSITLRVFLPAVRR